MTYFNQRENFVNKFGEGSAQVRQLDAQREAELTGRNSGMVDASAQSAQGPLAKPVNPLSQEDIEEANWIDRQIQKEHNRELYRFRKEYTDDPSNWSDSDDD